MSKKLPIDLPKSCTNLQKWIIYKLLKRGYGIYNSFEGKDDTIVWLNLPANDFYTYDSCSLIVEVGKKSLQNKASFRPSSQPYIHVTAYLILKYMKEWDRLTQFEILYKKNHSEIMEK